jgi:hypothetical protein
VLTACAFLLCGVATAGTITFSTTGAFGGNLFPGLRFAGVTESILGPPTYVTLGEFSLTGCQKPGTCTGSETFTLTIAEAARTGAVDQITGIVEKIAGQVAIKFPSPKFTLGGQTYTLPPVLFLRSQGMTPIAGTAVPEPTARLLLGLATLGLMGLTLASHHSVNN